MRPAVVSMAAAAAAQRRIIMAVTVACPAGANVLFPGGLSLHSGYAATGLQPPSNPWGYRPQAFPPGLMPHVYRAPACLDIRTRDLMQCMTQHDFPHDLVEAQTAWYRTYWQLAESGPTRAPREAAGACRSCRYRSPATRTGADRRARPPRVQSSRSSPGVRSIDKWLTTQGRHGGVGRDGVDGQGREDLHQTLAFRDAPGPRCSWRRVWRHGSWSTSGSRTRPRCAQRLHSMS